MNAFVGVGADTGQIRFKLLPFEIEPSLGTVAPPGGKTRKHNAQMRLHPAHLTHQMNILYYGAAFTIDPGKGQRRNLPPPFDRRTILPRICKIKFTTEVPQGDSQDIEVPEFEPSGLQVRLSRHPVVLCFNPRKVIYPWIVGLQ